ncbi:uncharacterized protein LOC143534041 [Bidens hawaiensis]|uniref:uncharacterized protein LOC143534041 n=1 Tax=Bidens hawaiensis TaxID=980011 RepID=UPI00404B3416
MVIKRRFQHSKQTIHKFFHEVLDKMMLFTKDIIVPTSFNPNPNIPGHNKRLRKIFKGVVGALDGTLIHAVVPTRQQDLYRGMGKGDCYQNVLAICDFNIIFTFLVAGWEGVAHNSRILSEALSDPHAPFPFPLSEKYYLCDVVYAHIRGFMAPYRNVRFTILKRMAPFPLETQRNVTIACFALHNFIRKQVSDDELFTQYDQPNVSIGNSRGQIDADEDEVEALGTASYREYMTQLRDEIAEQLMQSTE